MICLAKNQLAALFKCNNQYWIITEDFNDCYGIEACCDDNAIAQYKKVYWRN